MANPNFAKLLTKKYGALDDPNRKGQAVFDPKRNRKLVGDALKSLNDSVGRSVRGASGAAANTAYELLKNLVQGKYKGKVKGFNQGTTKPMRYRRGTTSSRRMDLTEDKREAKKK